LYSNSAAWAGRLGRSAAAVIAVLIFVLVAPVAVTVQKRHRFGRGLAGGRRDGTRRMTRRSGAAARGLAATLTLPVSIPGDWSPNNVARPGLSLMGLLSPHIGLPFLLLAAGSPLFSTLVFAIR
jgi:hypothetical protein